MFRQKGEISLLVSIFGVIVSIIGLSIGSALLKNTTINSSSADSFPYKAVLEIRDESGAVVPWEAGMTWANSITTTKNIGDIKDPNQSLARLTWDTGNVQSDIQNTLANVTITLPAGYIVVTPFCTSNPERICNVSDTRESRLIRKNIEIAKNGVVTYGVIVRKPVQPGIGNLEVQVVALNFPQRLKYFDVAHVASREPASCERVSSGQQRPLYLYNFTITAECISGDCQKGKTYEVKAEKRKGYVTLNNLPTGRYSIHINNLDDKGFTTWGGCAGMIYTISKDKTNQEGVIILQNMQNGIYDDTPTEELCRKDDGKATIVQDIDNILCYYANGKRIVATPQPVQPVQPTRPQQPIVGPRCGQQCVYSELRDGITKCFQGNCPVGETNCGLNNNCYYVPNCSTGAQVTCPGHTGPVVPTPTTRQVPPVNPPKPLPGKPCTNIAGNGEYKVIFVPDDFPDLASFEAQVRAAIANIQSSDLKDLYPKLSFYMHNDVKIDHNCRLVVTDNNGAKWTDISCGGTAKVRSECGGDPSTVVFIWNTAFSEFAQAGANVAYVPVPRVTISTAHELGHAIARLYDEYIYEDQSKWPEGEEPEASRVNCAPSTDTKCSKWDAEHSTEFGCFKGCSHRDWYRPIDQFSIMNFVDFRVGKGSVWNSMQLNEWRNQLSLAGVSSFADVNLPTYHTSTHIVLNQDAENNLKLVSIENESSYPLTKSDLLTSKYYVITLYDDKGGVLFQKKEDKETINLEEGPRNNGLTKTIELFLPFFENGDNVQITNELGNLVLNIPLAAHDLRIVDTQQNLCGNDICDKLIGETASSCSQDCKVSKVTKTELQRVDFDGDGTITSIDLATFIDSYGTPAGDINGDGLTNAIDYSLVIKWYGVTL